MNLTFAETIKPNPAMDSRDLALLAARGKANNKKLTIPGTEKMQPEERSLAAWIIEYAAQQKITFNLAMAHVFAFLKREPKNLAYYPGANISFADTAAGHQNRLAALGTKLMQVQRLPPGEATKLNERNTAIGEAKKYHGGMINYKIPDGMVLSDDEVDLVEWIMAYAGMKKLPFKEAMDHIFEYLKSFPDDLKKYTEGDISFAETSGRPIRPPNGWAYAEGSLGHLKKLHIYQAGTGCGFMEAARVLGVGANNYRA